MRYHLVAALVSTSLLGAAPVYAAGNEADFHAALAGAETAEQAAGALKNQWTTTEQALAEAKKEAAAGNFDKATELAKHAEALANASVAQAKEQATAWKNAEIR